MIMVYLLITGICFGSFINALVWRIHEQQSTVYTSSIKKHKSTSSLKFSASSVKSKEMSIVSGRSMCPHCRHQLSAVDLIPILSWLQLRGKCRYCHATYEDTPVTEIVTPLLFVVSYIYWPLAWNYSSALLFVLWLIFVVSFVALVIYDIRWLLLPNRIVAPLFFLSLVHVFMMATIYHGGVSAILGAVYGLLIGGGIFFVLFHVPGKELIGGGDVKLGAVLGLLVGGPWPALLLLFTASCLGSLFSLPLLITGKANRGTKIPFGPFLIAATIIVYLFGSSIIAWYKKLLMIG